MTLNATLLFEVELEIFSEWKRGPEAEERQRQRVLQVRYRPLIHTNVGLLGGIA